MLLEGPDTACGKHYHTHHIATCSQRPLWSHRYDNDNSSIYVVMACHCSKDILESSSLPHHSSVSYQESWGVLFQTAHQETLFRIPQLNLVQFCWNNISIKHATAIVESQQYSVWIYWYIASDKAIYWYKSESKHCACFTRNKWPFSSSRRSILFSLTLKSAKKKNSKACVVSQLSLTRVTYTLTKRLFIILG